MVAGKGRDHRECVLDRAAGDLIADASGTQVLHDHDEVAGTGVVGGVVGEGRMQLGLV
jgi:hypothetical protein